LAYDLCVRKVPSEYRERLDLRSREVAFNGAEPVRPETIDRFSQAFAVSGFRRQAFHPCYGLAEATLMVTASRPLAGPVVNETVAGCGSAVAATSVRIVDPETHKEITNGAGEIWVAGPSVAPGYWNLPEETTKVFHAKLNGDPQPYLRTGDLGYVLDGELYCTGRLKDLIVLDGVNYHPHEIEASLKGAIPHSAMDVLPLSAWRGKPVNNW
jgi:acyl-CoA synthetase (AMP-forming)/AMP-acid ligase II